MNRQRVCCFTGHRFISNTELPSVIKRLDETIAELSKKGVIFFGSGGATGFDQKAAYAVIKARESNSAIKLIMVLPCRNQDALWNAADKKEYRRLLDAADKIVYVSEHYYNGCMKARNLHLVENSGICVAYMKYGKSGTAQTVRLARECGLTVINLAEN